MTAALVALLPRDGTLAEHGVARFRQTAALQALRVHRLACGAALAVDGPAGVGRTTALVGAVYTRSGEAACDPHLLVERTERAALALPPPGCWGDYLALAGAPGGAISLSRAPFGNLPCFWTDLGHAVLAASSLPLLASFGGGRPPIDWRQLAIYLLSPQMRSAATCLEGIHELPPGAALLIRRQETCVEWRWSPWTHAGSGRPLATREDAASAMRAAIDHAVAARCGGLTDPVLLLSGGLDSSTLAASLAAAGCRFRSLTMVTRHRSGDERRYARAVAAATGSPLTEQLRALAAIDWEDATPARLPRPSARLFRQPTLAAAIRLAASAGADTIIDGGGGDDLFCSLQSVVPLLDRLRVEGPGRGTWTTARDLALRADVSLWAVLARAAGRLASGRVAFRWPVDASFLSDDVGALAPEAVRHDWLQPPPGALAGEAAHVALVLDALGLAEDASTNPAFRTISPLMAQPVVETALRIRSWLWFDHGRNRAVIRRAFADRLPAEVLARTGKGTPLGFIGEIVEANLARLRRLLLDGLLVDQGLADARAIEAALTPGAVARHNRYAQLLILADAERWARLWR